jgi:hypothetical protein
VAVICIALVWFNQHVHPLQGVGVGLTFLGLWMYNNAKGDIARGETRRRGVEAAREGVLPMTRSEERALDMTVNIPLVPCTRAADRGARSGGVKCAPAGCIDITGAVQDAHAITHRHRVPTAQGHFTCAAALPITTDILGLATAHSCAEPPFLRAHSIAGSRLPKYTSGDIRDHQYYRLGHGPV